MLTTVYLLRDIYSILMESTPRDVRSKDLLRDLRRVDGVHCVSCLHIWQVRIPRAKFCAKAQGIGLYDPTDSLCGNCVQLAPGKVCLSAKIHTLPDADSEDVLRDALSYAKYKYGLTHSTIQVTSDETLL